MPSTLIYAEPPLDSAQQEAQGLSLDEVPPLTLRNAWGILEHEDAVRKVDPDHFEVLSVHDPNKRIRVARVGSRWRCRVDKHSDPHHPCSHLLAALFYEGLIDLQGAPEPERGRSPRNHALEGEAWTRQYEEFPALLARLLRETLPVIASEPPYTGVGRPPVSLFAQLYQSIAIEASTYSLRSLEGLMELDVHRRNNPYRPVSRATLSRFRNDPETTPILERLLAMTTWPAMPYDCIHTNEHHVTHYYFKALPGEKRDKKNRPIEFTWAQILLSHEYNLITAARVQRGYFREPLPDAPLHGEALLLLDVRRKGNDEASCRSHAATGSHTFRRTFRGPLRSLSPVAQHNEFLSRAIAHNLNRLIYLSLDQDIEIDFEHGTYLLAKGELGRHVSLGLRGFADLEALDADEERFLAAGAH